MHVAKVEGLPKLLDLGGSDHRREEVIKLEGTSAKDNLHWIYNLVWSHTRLRPVSYTHLRAHETQSRIS